MFGYTMYACARARKCVHVHAFVHLRAGMGVCVHACMRACVRACLRVCMPACLHACVHMCVRVEFYFKCKTHTYISQSIGVCVFYLFEGAKESKEKRPL